MIEWTKKYPSDGSKKIIRSFSFLPKKCEQNKVVWFDWVYVFCSYFYTDYQIRRKVDSDDVEGYWIKEATLSPSQFKEYINNIPLHLSDSDTDVRDYAQAAKRFIKSK